MGVITDFLCPCPPQRCIQLRKSEDHASAALEKVINHFYAGDWLSSFRTIMEAIKAVEVIKFVLSERGFELAQWAQT